MNKEKNNLNPVKELFKAYIGKEPRKGGPEIPPVSRWLNGILKAVEDESLTVEIDVRPELANPAGFLHGGVQAAIIDEIIGMTLFMMSEESLYVSANIYIDYLSKAKVGQKIQAKSKIIRKGRNIINAECKLVDEKGVIVAKGVSNFYKSGIALPKY